MHTARSFLFLPAHRLDRLQKAFGSGAHVVVIDLEDAVAADDKPIARAALHSIWQGIDADQRGRLAVRINAVATPWYRDDLQLVSQLSGLGGVMPAKAESATQLQEVGRAAPGSALLPLIESAAGWSRLAEMARCAQVARLVFGHLDFQLDLGIHCSADERELDAARFAFIVESRLADIAPPVDGVTTHLSDMDRLEEDASRSRCMGFGAKLCIHPNQVEPVNRILGPTQEQVQWATRLLEAAATQSAGAFQFEGRMVDAPVLAQARSFLGLSPQRKFR